MKTEYVKRIDEPAETLQARLEQFYTSIGYRLVGQEAGALTFRRGSFLRGGFSFSPKAWKSVVRATLAPDADGQVNVTIAYDVNTTGQTITQGEADFWDAELRALDEAVTTGFIQPADSRKAERAAIRGNWRYLSKLLLGIPLALLVYAPVIAVSYLVAMPVTRALLRLRPNLGTEGLSILLAVLLLATFAAVLFPLPRLSARLAGWLNRVWPGRLAKVVQSALMMAGWGVSLGFMWSLFGILRALESGMQLPLMVGVIVGIFVIAFIYDRREKKMKASKILDKGA